MPLDNYQITKKLGSGKYAAVYQAKRTTDGKLFALKRVQLHEGQPKVRSNALN
jgi:serine/threonine protein kinase